MSSISSSISGGENLFSCPVCVHSVRADRRSRQIKFKVLSSRTFDAWGCGFEAHRQVASALVDSVGNVNIAHERRIEDCG